MNAPVPAAHQRAAAPTPAVDLRIELGSALIPIYDPPERANYPEEANLIFGISFELSMFAARVGLNVEPNVTIEATDSARTVQFRLNGMLVPYPPSLMREVWMSVSDKDWSDSARFSTAQPDAFPDEWLNEAAVSDEKAFWVFLRRLALAVVMRQPALLLTENVVRHYLGADVGVEPRSACRPLQLLLGKGYALQDRAGMLVQALKAGRAADPPLSDEAVIQGLIASLDTTVEIHANPRCWESLIPGGIAQDMLLTMVSDTDLSVSIEDFHIAFFNETGIYPPPIRLVSSPEMPDERVVIRINDLSSIALRLIPADTLLAIEPLDVATGMPIQLPRGSRAVLYDRAMKDNVEQASIAVLTPFDYMLDLTAEYLSRRRDWLLRVDDVEFLLSRLHEDLWHKSLVQSVLSGFSLSEVAFVLGELAHERISIRNLAEILSQILVYDAVPLDSAGHATFGDQLILSPRLPTAWLSDWHGCLAFIRSRMRAYISHKCSGSDGILRVITLAPELEKRLLETLLAELSGTAAQGQGAPSPDLLTGVDHAALLAALWKFAAPAGGKPVCVRTDVNARPFLRRLIEVEFPDVPVIAVGEVDPVRSVEVLGQMDLNAASEAAPP